MKYGRRHRHLLCRPHPQLTVLLILIEHPAYAMRLSAEPSCELLSNTASQSGKERATHCRIASGIASGFAQWPWFHKIAVCCCFVTAHTSRLLLIKLRHNTSGLPGYNLYFRMMAFIFTITELVFAEIPAID